MDNYLQKGFYAKKASCDVCYDMSFLKNEINETDIKVNNIKKEIIYCKNDIEYINRFIEHIKDTDAEILHEGNDFFRKMTNIIAEKKICELLMKNPHKNIVKIYDVGKDYIDMELLDVDMSREDMSKIKNIMMEVKTYLQSLGIMYIDWKLDNIGISEDGQLKLFDFNASGLIDIETKKWIIEPLEWWSYNKAIQNGMVTPIDIDNYAFDIEFTPLKN